MATVTAVLESAIYFLAICSLAQDDCERLQLGDRFALMDSFRKITEMLLAKAGLLTTTSLTVLQAFVLYLVSLSTPQRYHASLLWVFYCSPIIAWSSWTDHLDRLESAPVAMQHLPGLSSHSLFV